MFVKMFILVSFLVGLALIGLGIGMLIKKDGKFPETHIGRNPEMKKRGIHCVQTTDAQEREK